MPLGFPVPPPKYVGAQRAGGAAGAMGKVLAPNLAPAAAAAGTKAMVPKMPATVKKSACTYLMRLMSKRAGGDGKASPTPPVGPKPTDRAPKAAPSPSHVPAVPKTLPELKRPPLVAAPDAAGAVEKPPAGPTPEAIMMNKARNQQPDGGPLYLGGSNASRLGRAAAAAPRRRASPLGAIRAFSSWLGR